MPSEAKPQTRKKKSKKKKLTQAERADKYVLYQAAVQSPEHEAKFCYRLYRKAFGEHPTTLREDFCGTHAICCEWVKRHEHTRAIGVDLDPEPLQWGREHNQAELTDAQRARLTLERDDVRKTGFGKADVVAAQNFSYFIFDTRESLRGYFEAARENLAEKGVLLLDMLGGSEMHDEDQEDIRKIEGCKKVKYVWDQERFNPITHYTRFHIHFRFKDGSAIEPAFSYEWRLWTLPEIRELLQEAGFDRITVLWEKDEGNGDDEQENGGEADDVADADADRAADAENEDTHEDAPIDNATDAIMDYRPVTEATPDPSWICYIAAVKLP